MSHTSKFIKFKVEFKNNKFVSAKAVDKIELKVIEPEFFRSLETDKVAISPLGIMDSRD